MINVCITGHRPNKLYGYNMNNSKYDCLRKVIYNVIEKLYYKYNKRKIYMVDNSDIVIVVLNNSNNNNNDNNNKSGISNCYNYVKNKKDKDIILIDPVSFNVAIIKKR